MASIWFRISAFLLLLAAPLRADSIWVTSGGPNALELPGVQIKDIRDNKLVFIPTSGRETAREISQIARIQVADDPGLTAAETAFASAQWDTATDSYRKVLSTSQKNWVRLRSAHRLIDSAQKANRFDAAATGYIALILADPASAATRKLILPDERSTYLVTALADVATALSDSKLAPAQRQGLLGFQLDLQRARKDNQAAAETTEKLLQAGVTPDSASALAQLKLNQAATELVNKEFSKAIATIKSSSALFIDSKDQAQALFLLGDAQAAMAGQSNDPAALKDAALAYMRVVAHFKDSPLTPAALLKTAEIEEKLNDRPAASSLYQQIVTQYANTPSAAAAQERLKPKP